jgi:hypothetical protein
MGVPAHAPPAQVSATVQGLPSSQEAPVTNVYEHVPFAHVPWAP